MSVEGLNECVLEGGSELGVGVCKAGEADIALKYIGY
jgi:hypothetical protein